AAVPRVAPPEGQYGRLSRAGRLSQPDQGAEHARSPSRTRHALGIFCDMDFFTTPRSWSRYVALGDSLTAGRGDLGPDGRPVGWAQRLAVLLTDRTGVNCALTNLAVDGATVGRVLADQLPQVRDIGPELVSATVGMNDIRNAEFRPDDFAAD